MAEAVVSVPEQAKWDRWTTPPAADEANSRAPELEQRYSAEAAEPSRATAAAAPTMGQRRQDSKGAQEASEMVAGQEDEETRKENQTQQNRADVAVGAMSIPAPPVLECSSTAFEQQQKLRMCQ